MQIGMVGLGRMDASMVRRLIAGGHKCVVFKHTPKKIEELIKDHKAIGASSLANLVNQLQKPCVLWPMVPAAVVDGFIAELLPLLEPGDIPTSSRDCVGPDFRTAGYEATSMRRLLIATGL